jgi:hypothetical protein
MRKIMHIVIVILVINGCISQIVSIDDYTKNWVGRPIEDLKKIISRPGSYASRIDWKEKTYSLDNGNWVYVEPDSKNCFILWEVNPKGIIVSYTLEGNCH